MRVMVLATAALAATLAFAAPAAAQGSPETIQKLCPDLTYNQIKTELSKLIEDYDFSNDPTEAAMQAASLLCEYGQAAEVEDEDVKTTPALSVVPPPHFNGPKPRFAPPRYKMRPHAHRMPPRMHRRPPPHYGYRPAPPRGYGPPPAAGAGGYGRHAYGYGSGYAVGRPQKQSFSRQETPYCKSQDEVGPAPAASREGMPYAYCEWMEQIPGKSCGGYHCSTIARK